MCMPQYVLCTSMLWCDLSVCVRQIPGSLLGSGMRLLILLFSWGAPYSLRLALPMQPAIITARGRHTRVPVTQDLLLNHQPPNRSALFSWGPLQTHHCNLTVLCSFLSPHPSMSLHPAIFPYHTPSLFLISLFSPLLSLSLPVLYASAAQHCWRQQLGSPL